MKKILLLTDPSNGEIEDQMITDYLQKFYEVTISYFDNIPEPLEVYNGIIIRNTWPNIEEKYPSYRQFKTNFRELAKQKNIKLYNSSDGSGDMAGKKDYIVELFKNDYPVIPSIDSINDLGFLPQCDKFLIKPKNGASSFGVRTINLDELYRLQNTENLLIQPKYDYIGEISFYFVDTQFIYSTIFKPSKIPNWPEPEIYYPNKDELLFAEKFVAWNKLTNGIQRVDALLLKNNSLLLLELEDDSPYLSLPEINLELRNNFLNALNISIKKYFDL